MNRADRFPAEQQPSPARPSPATRAGDPAGLQKSHLIAVTIFSVAYFQLTIWISRARMIWSDEFFTLYLSRLPDTVAIWEVLQTGADQHPLGFYLVTHYSLRWFGENGLALRLPAIVGVWLACMSVWALVARRTSFWTGLIAALALLSTTAFRYSFEARGYGLMLGCGAFSLFCWQLAGEQKWRKIATLGLAIGLMAVVCFHYYGVFMVGPLAVGQFIREWRRGRRNWHVWIAILAIALPLLATLPLIQSAREFADGFWAQPNWNFGLWCYSSLIETGGTVLIVCTTLVMIKRMLQTQGADHQSEHVPREEVAAIAILILLPIIALVCAKITGIGLYFRYVLIAVIGIAVVFAWVMDSLSSQVVRERRILVVLLGTWCLMMGFVHLGKSTIEHLEQRRRWEWIASSTPDSLPIVVTENDLWHRVWYYGPADLHQRVHFVADPEKALQYLGQNTVDRCAVTLKPWFPPNLSTYTDFTSRNSEFYLVAGLDRDWEWMLSEISAREYDVKFEDRYEHLQILRVKISD